MEKLTSTSAAAGRLLIAVIFIASGLTKLSAPAATIGYIAAVGLPAPQVGYAGAVLVELGIGFLFLIGFKTRIMALVLAGFCVATAIFFHRAVGDPNQAIHFLKNLAMAGGLLQIAAFGGGALSVDALRQRPSPLFGGRPLAQP